MNEVTGTRDKKLNSSRFHSSLATCCSLFPWLLSSGHRNPSPTRLLFMPMYCYSKISLSQKFRNNHRSNAEWGL